MAARAGYSRGAQLLEEWRGALTQAEARRLLRLDKATYNRYERGVRKPTGQATFDIERLTDGRVPAKSWYEPPITKQAKAS